MRKLMNRLMGISLLSLLLIASAGQKVQAQDVEVSYQTFYDNLSPYGQWVYDPQYGNVWVPNEGGDFRPYGSRGHWVMTDYGNTWVSEDPWGWAVYHYGRWTYDPYYGWLWIPGYEWAPAWVSWRYGGGYSGWAPMGPGMRIGVSYGYPDSWWIFVAPQYMYVPNCYSYWRGPQYNTTYIRQTTIVNNYYMDNRTHVRYNYGPRRDVIERDTHQPVQVYRVSQTNRPGAHSVNGNRVSMYRPNVNRTSSANARPGNVVQAPREISRRPQPATNVAATHQAPFRQEVQKQNNNTRQDNNPRQQAPANANPGGRQPADNPRQGTREQRNNQQPDRTPQNNAPRNNQEQTAPGRRDTRQEQRQQPNVNQQDQRQQQVQQQRDQQQRQQNVQQQRDQQQRQQNVQQQRDQQQRQQQMQQQRDQQQRQQQQRNQPPPQQQRPAPPQHQQQPREGGRRF